MATLTLQGTEIHTNGDLPRVGDSGPDFVLVNSKMEDVSLSTYKDKMKLLSIVPSLDTPVCAMRSRNFAKDYGVLITDGPLAGITARAIVVLNEENTVVHSELISEISHEPDYDMAVKILDAAELL